MTNVQFYFAIGVPFFTILVVWLGTALLNRSAFHSLNLRIDDLRSEMKAGFDALSQRLERLEARLDRIDHEIRVDHEHRLTILEQRVFAKTG
jgi:hypothetical protein